MAELRGASYNLVLIVVPLTFWAMVRWRYLTGLAIAAWRRHRAAQVLPLPPSGPDTPDRVAPQVTPSPAMPGQGAGTGAGQGWGQGPGEGSGQGWRPQVETLPNGVAGVWIKVGQPGDDRG